jgi:hypothetical protein
VILIGDLEASIREWRGISKSGFLEWCFLYLPGIAMRILFLILWHWNAVLLDHRVELPIYHRINSQAEEMLMVCGQDSRTHDCSPFRRLTGIDQLCR